MLTAGEIAEMRGIANQTLAGTAVIQGGTVVSDSGGGGTLTWANRGTVDCHISPILVRGEREDVEGGRIDQQADWIVTLPANTTISVKDRIVIDSTFYEVEAVRAPRTWELTRRVEVSQVS